MISFSREPHVLPGGAVDEAVQVWHGQKLIAVIIAGTAADPDAPVLQIKCRSGDLSLEFPP